MKVNTCLLALILGVSSAAVAAAPGETIADKVGTGAYPAIAVDAAGHVHLVYVREGKLWYRQRDARTQKWSAERRTGIDQGPVHRSQPRVVVDSQNRPHVLVGRSYAWWDGTSWQSLEPGVERDTGMAIDADDNIYLVRRGGAQGGYLGLRVRKAGASTFESLADPDTSDGLPRGSNDHVYGSLAVSPFDGSLHVVYRHAAPRRFGYRVSSDGGRTWAGAGISDDDAEAPSVTVAADRRVYAVGGSGAVFRREGGPDAWRSLGRALVAGARDLPVVAVDDSERVYVACFGGRWNVLADGRWIGEGKLPAPSGEPLGFVSMAATRDGGAVYAAWEEGASMRKPLEAHDPVGEGTLWFTRLDPAQLAAEQRAAIDSDDRAPPAVPAKVGQWDRFEAGVVNRKPYRDPFREVSLDVVYTRPDGSTVDFRGFHDGGALWLFRFMPDQIGMWKYEARFSDGAAGLAGTFQCVASDVPGMIGVDEANPVWFGHRGGGQVLIRGFHVGDRFFAANWPGEQRTQFLDWAGRQGYNLLSIASHYLKRQAADRGAHWETPNLWPLNPAEYRRMESVLDDLAKRRIMVFPFAGFFGRSSNFPADPADQELYIRYTLARIGPYWNLLLNVGGPEPHLPHGSPYLAHDEVHRLGRLIRQCDVFGHALSIHNPTGDDIFRDADWLTYGTLQGPKTHDLVRLNQGLLKNHHPEKPLLAQETLWSRNQNHPHYPDDQLSRNAWVIHMSAAALVFADNGGGNSSAGFSGSMDPSQAEQQRHDIIKQVWDLAEQFPFHRMKPRQDLVDHGFCLAEPGQHYLVYLPAAGKVDVKVEGGPFRVQWINARDGTDRRAGGTTRDGAGLPSPGAGQPWLLWLVKQSR